MRHRHAAATACGAAVLLTVLTGCSALEPLVGSNTTSAVYRSTEQFREAAGDLRVEVPEWVSDDAETVRLTMRDRSVIMMTSPESTLENCTDNGTTPEPPIIDSWWPLETPGTALDCDGGWVVFSHGSSTFGYRD